MNDVVSWPFRQILDAMGERRPELLGNAKVNSSFTEYTLRGPLDAVLEAIKLIFTQYDPQGYGTFVQRLEHDYPGPGYRAAVWRANSCD